MARPTIHDIARRAGVSAAVVSHVINDHPGHVGAATRRRKRRAHRQSSARRPCHELRPAEVRPHAGMKANEAYRGTLPYGSSPKGQGDVMKRHAVLAVALLVVGMVLSGLSPAQAQVTTLRFLWFTDGPDKPAIEGLVKRFNDTNPDIKIEFSIVPFAELNQLLSIQTSGYGM